MGVIKAVTMTVALLLSPLPPLTKKNEKNDSSIVDRSIIRSVDRSHTKRNFQISIGRGWDGTVWTDGMERWSPSPGQLKFEIWKLTFSRENSRPTTIGRPSDDHPNTVRRPPDTKTNCEKTKYVPNDGSRHEDQFCPKIVKIGAILKGPTSVQSF